MADNIIRRELVQIGWDVEPSPFNKIDGDIDKLKKTFEKFSNEPKQMSKALKTLNQQKLTQLSRSVDNVAKKMGSGLVTAAKTATKAIATMGAALGGAAIGGAVKGVNYNAQMETYRTSFEVMTGSAEKAMEVTTKLQKMGAATPFEMTDLASATQLLMNYGFTADDAIGRMSMLGDIAQGDADKMNSIATAYGQMSSAGKVSLEDVKQMINAGFNPLQEISSSTGESMASLYDRISKGTISVDEITASMQRSTSEGGRYFQSMEKQSKTFNGQLSTMKDNASQFLGALTSGLTDKLAGTVMPKINALLGEMTDAFNKGGVSALFDVLTKKLGPVGATLQTIVNKVKAFASNSEKMAKIKSIFETLKTIGGNIASIFGKIVDKVWDFATSSGTLTTVKNVLGDISDAISWAKDNFEKIKEVVVSVGIAFGIFYTITKAISLFNAVMTVFKTIQTISAAAQLGFNAALLACPITWIVVAIVALIAIIVLLVRNWDTVKAAAVACWEKIKEAFGIAASWLNEKVVQPVANFFKGLWDGITNAVSTVKDTIVGAFQDAWDKVTGIWNGITDFFTGIWDGIKNIVNKIIGKGEEAKGASDKVTKHARGGYFTSPHLGLVAEAGPEFIIPTRDKNRGRSLWEKAGKVLGMLPASGMTVGGGSTAKVSSVPQVRLPSYTPSSSVTNNTSSSETNNYSPQFTLNMHGTVDRTTERTIKQWVREAMDEAFESISRTSPKLTEV